MKRRLFAAAILIPVLLILWGSLAAIGFGEKPLLNTSDYDLFTARFRNLTLGFALSLFFLTIILPRATSQEPVSTTDYRKKLGSWLVGFVGVITAAAILVMYMNPEGRYPFQKRE